MSLGAVLRLSALALALAPATTTAADTPPEPFQGMKYRLIGPWRGGRAMAAVGIPSDPHTYYLGATGGGVWKTTNGGGSWTSLFDKQPVASIGAIAVAESDPNIVYAGEYGGYISRYDHRTRQARSVSIYPENPWGHGGEDLKYRFQ